MKKLSMKKTTAAAVTAAVGAALLLGGAGTLAYWTDEAASADQTISSGSLDLGTLDSGDWTVTNGAVVDAAFTGGIVPGDVLTGTIAVPVTLTGQNIEADLLVDNLELTADAAAPTDLASALELEVVSVDGTAGNTETFTESDTVDVVVTITFPMGAAGEYNSTTLASFESGSLVFTADYTLTQVAKS
jgi:alternate signal-mediated exported protein